MRRPHPSPILTGTDELAACTGNLLSNTLNDQLSYDLASDAAKDIVAELNRDHQGRFVLVDKESGLLESRIVFTDPQDAEEHMLTIKSDQIAVAMLLA